MRTNKKAILGFAMAMIFSLAILQGYSTKNSKRDVSMQQIALSCASVADRSEGVAYAGWSAAAGTAGAFASGFFVAGGVTAGTVVGAPVGAANFLLGGICTL